MGDISSLYVDPTEQTLGVLGTNYLQNFLTSGMLSKGFCALTDKRVYFKGKCFTNNGGHYKSNNEQRTLDVKDVTGTGFTAIRLMIFLVIAIISVFTGALCVAEGCSLYGWKYDGLAVLLIVFGILHCLVFWGLFIVKKTKVFEIEYAGGKIAFPISAYNYDEIQNFQNALRLAKDNYVAPQQNNNQQQITGSGADEILKYKQLLDAGAISQEEFESAKAKLLR